MQTFLPYPCFAKSVLCLDKRRLGKQRVEALQCLNALNPESTSRWKNHPACKMWIGFEGALRNYMRICIIRWIDIGCNNTMQIPNVILDTPYPTWLGDEDFHRSHKSNLLRKDITHYGQFGWTEPDDLEYVWPRST